MCHKTAGLVANALESSGIATVVIGTLHEPLQKVPRSLVTPYRDAPCGPPGDNATHRAVLLQAMSLLYRSRHTMENFETKELAV